MNPREKQKSNKFKELAEKRVKMTTDCLRKIKNLSNKTNYHYTDKDVEKIFSHLEQELINTKNSFSQAAKEDGFSL